MFLFAEYEAQQVTIFASLPFSNSAAMQCSSKQLSTALFYMFVVLFGALVFDLFFLRSAKSCVVFLPLFWFWFSPHLLTWLPWRPEPDTVPPPISLPPALLRFAIYRSLHPPSSGVGVQFLLLLLFFHAGIA